jgi:hypothetical protein
MPAEHHPSRRAASLSETGDEFAPENPLARMFANLVIRAEGTVTNPTDATAQAEGTVTNPKERDD